MSASTTPDTFEQVGRWLGDLDHPTYDDERRRWVWYEASAVAFQVALIGSYLMAAITILVTSQVGLVLILMLPILVATITMTAWVQRHRAEYKPSVADFRSRRGAFGIASVMLFLAAVTYRVVDYIPVDGSFGKGFVQGASAGAITIAVVAVGLVLTSRNRR